MSEGGPATWLRLRPEHWKVLTGISFFWVIADVAVLASTLTDFSLNHFDELTLMTLISEISALPLVIKAYFLMINRYQRLYQEVKRRSMTVLDGLVLANWIFAWTIRAITWREGFTATYATRLLVLVVLGMMVSCYLIAWLFLRVGYIYDQAGWRVYNLMREGDHCEPIDFRDYVAMMTASQENL